MSRAAPHAPRRVLASLAVMTATMLAASALAPASPARASSSSDLVAYTNSARADRGMGTLSIAADLTRVAQRHAEWMAAHRTLAHSSNLGGSVCCWRAIGENVGMGSSAREIFDAFMGSASHRSNILSSRYTQIGVGSARSGDGRLWVDQVFRQPDSSAAAGASSRSTSQRAGRAASRSSLAVSPKAGGLSAEQLRRARLAERIRRLAPIRSGDPITRSLVWLRQMQRVTAA